MKYRIEQFTGTSKQASAEFDTIEEARDATAKWLGKPLRLTMQGACPDEEDDGLIGIECWMPYLDNDHIPDGTVFIYRSANRPLKRT